MNINYVDALLPISRNVNQIAQLIDEVQHHGGGQPQTAQRFSVISDALVCGCDIASSTFHYRPFRMLEITGRVISLKLILLSYSQGQIPAKKALAGVILQSLNIARLSIELGYLASDKPTYTALSAFDVGFRTHQWFK